jgi:hypothetical protein
MNPNPNSTAPQPQGLPQDLLDRLARDMVKGGKSVNWLAERIEREVRASIASPTGWIPVSERLPASDEMVQFWDGWWCYGKRGDTDPESRQWLDFSSRDRDGDPRDTYEVTHWMPLPSAPTTPGA